MNRLKKGLLILCMGFYTLSSFAQQKFTVSGYVKDIKNGEDLIGATVFVKETKEAASTNSYGFYSLTLAEGKYTLSIQYVGFKAITRSIDLSKSQTINFNISEETVTTEEIVISERRADANISDIKMSKVDMNIAQLKKLPALFGEPDLIKLVQLQPGVISAGEGTGAFFVRGGSADQNLILYDEAPIYDPSHIGGLLSAFNSSIIKTSELYKGGIPAQFGGRLSSVLDVRSIDGNNRKFTGGIGLGLLAAKANIQGPIGSQLFKRTRMVTDSTDTTYVEEKVAKASFMLSARRSFVGYLFKISPSTKNNDVYFYDVNAKINYNIDAKNRIFVSTYLGRDVLKFGSLFSFNWGNTTGTLRWNHIFNSKLFSNTTLIASNYDYSLELVNIFTWKAGIQEFSLKQDFNYYLSPKNTLNFGVSVAYRQFTPGNFIGASARIPTINLEKLAALDNALYISNKQEVTKRLSLEYGVRLSLFLNMGPGKFYTYKDPQAVTNITRVDSTSYNSGSVVRSFINPEPRFSARYMLNERNALKLSYNRMVQNVHQIVSGIVPLPTNFWLPSTTYLKPQLADQFAAGYFRNMKDNMYEFSIEGFYKYMQNSVDFADNSNVFLNPDLPVFIRQGTAWSYGTELFLVKSKGRLTGQIGYTLSWAERNIPGVNANRTYFSSYDRRNALNIVATYDLTKRLNIGLTFTYSTGRPITLPTGKYNIEGIEVNVISERNGYRLPDFHRLDLSATWKSKVIPGRWWNSELTLSIYNVYNRKNPFTIYVQNATTDSPNSDGTIAPGDAIPGTTKKEAVLIYVFPILPSISYNFNF